MSRVTQAHIDQRRDDIIEAARELFIQQGWQQTTMQAVAARAGISTGAIYRYFENKDALIRAVFEYGAELVRSRIVEHDGTGGVLETLRHLGASVLDDPQCGDPRLELSLAIACADDPEGWGLHARATAREILGMLRGLVEAGKATGVIGSDLDTESLALILYFVVPGMASLTLQLGERPNSDAILRTMVTLLARSKEGEKS